MVQPAWHRLGAQAQEAGLWPPGAGKHMCSPSSHHSALHLRPGISSASWGSRPPQPLPSAEVTLSIREGCACARALHRQRGAEGANRKGHCHHGHSLCPFLLGPSR